MNVLIIASGRLEDPGHYSLAVQAADLVICADGGVRHARRLGLVPGLVIGDLDSLDAGDAEFLERSQVRIIRHPVDKDATDGELAADWAMDNGATAITLIGATGTRLDHTLANLLLLKNMADRGVPGWIMDEHNLIRLTTRTLTLTGSPGDFLSIIPVGGTAVGVTLTGLDFPLTRATIPMGSTLGVSNRFSGTEATVTLEQGTLLVTQSRD